MLGEALGNDLQAAALSLRPALADVLKAGRGAGALAGLVSGSGPTCVFLADDGHDAARDRRPRSRPPACAGEARTVTGPGGREPGVV